MQLGTKNIKIPQPLLEQVVELKRQIREMCIILPEGDARARYSPFILVRTEDGIWFNRKRFLLDNKGITSLKEEVEKVKEANMILKNRIRAAIEKGDTVEITFDGEFLSREGARFAEELEVIHRKRWIRK